MSGLVNRTITIDLFNITFNQEEELVERIEEALDAIMNGGSNSILFQGPMELLDEED